MNTTVASLKDDGYFLANKVSNKLELINMLHYIDFLANTNVVNIGSLELPIEENTFKLTKAEVTKLFFSHIESRQEEIAKAVVPIPQNIADLIGEYVNLSKRDLASEQMRQVRDMKRSARDHLDSFHDALNSAIEKQRSIDAAKDTDATVMIKDLSASLHKTNWDFYQWDSYRKRISFVSRADIMLTHKLADAGLDYDINCGRFLLEIGLSEMRIRVRPYGGCVSREDALGEDDEEDDGWNIHPNIDSGGEVCWGNAADSMITARLQGNILKILQILDALLPNYGQPAYVDIEQFQKDINARDARLRSERIHGKETKEEEAEELEQPELIGDDEPEETDYFEELDSGGEADADANTTD